MAVIRAVHARADHYLLNQTALNINHKPVVNIVLQQSLHGGVDVINSDALTLTGEVVLTAEIQHFLRFLDPSNRTTANSQPACR